MKAYLQTHQQSALLDTMIFPCSTQNINDAAIHWEQKGKEFELHGEMYDVVNITYTKHTAVVVCIKDSNETKLKQALAKLMRKKHNNNNPAQQLLQLIYTLSNHEYVLAGNSIVLSHHTLYTCYFPVVYHTIALPPPQQLFT